MGSPSKTLARDVDQRAVAEIDGVVETVDEGTHALLARHELHHALASETRLRVLAYRRRQVVFRRTRDRSTGTSGYTLPVENTTMRDCAKCSATRAGTMVLVAHVTSVRSSVPNFLPARNSTFGESGSAVIAAGSSRSQATVRMPSASSPLAHGRRRESRRGEHAYATAGAPGRPVHAARERRSHLAAGAEDQDVAIQTADARRYRPPTARRGGPRALSRTRSDRDHGSHG